MEAVVVYFLFGAALAAVAVFFIFNWLRVDRGAIAIRSPRAWNAVLNLVLSGDSPSVSGGSLDPLLVDRWNMILTADLIFVLLKVDADGGAGVEDGQLVDLLELVGDDLVEVVGSGFKLTGRGRQVLAQSAQASR
jgi:hypothetical protein